MLGKMGHFTEKMGKDSTWDKTGGEAARTVPGRENGGNCDIKNLSRGCVVYLPVFVPGGNLSMGDMHFSQGDGEVSFCGAIEMSGFLDLKLSVIKGGMKLLPVVGPSPLSVNPIFEIGAGPRERSPPTLPRASCLSSGTYPPILARFCRPVGAPLLRVPRLRGHLRR